MINPHIDISGWQKLFARAKDAGEASAFRLFFDGDHSVLNQSNDRIAEHIIDNGAELWTFSDEALPECASIVAAGVARIVSGEQENLEEEFDEAGQLARADIYAQIMTGEIPGTYQSAEWAAYKAKNFPGPTPPLVASGEWAESLTHEVVRK